MRGLPYRLSGRKFRPAPGSAPKRLAAPGMLLGLPTGDSGLNPLRIHVVPLGRGYLAESDAPVVTAMGSSAEEAAENGRLMAMALFEAYGAGSHPVTLIVRIDEPGRSGIAMQPMNRPFCLARAGKESGTCYFDSEGNASAIL